VSGKGEPPWENQRVQVGTLGSFEVRTDDGILADVPGARLRALLIALALEPGRVVSKATLIDWIRRVHRELLDLDGMCVELGQQGSNRFRPTIAGNPQDQLLLVVPRGVGQDPHRGVEFEVAREPEPDIYCRGSGA
jgi:hypothetical protein